MHQHGRAPTAPGNDAELDAAIAAISDPRAAGERPGSRHAALPGAPAGARRARSPTAAGSTPRSRPRSARRSALDDPQERLRAVDALIAEETRLAMLVGVAVGFELAGELGYAPEPDI